MPQRMQVLVTGATGYIGGRLVPRLLAAGIGVRCLARDPARLRGFDWPGVELRRGDVGDAAGLRAALAGIDQAYYLVHAMGGGSDFARRDLELAHCFAAACAAVGVRRIVYLGGLGGDTGLSPHLRSRQEVGRALAAHGVPVLELRAAVIVGSGSASFEMLRYLSERLPVMITPRWVHTRCQPIGVGDVLRYLVEALDHPALEGVLEIGGSEVLSYRDMMLAYARERGLRRWIVPVPVLSPRLSGYWVDLVTPIPSSIARPLIEGVASEVVVHDSRALEVFGFEPLGFRQALRRALERIGRGEVETVWSSSLASLGEAVPAGSSALSEGVFIERHRRRCRAPATALFAAACALGGDRGWPAGPLWRLRAALDRMLGGVGMRRGRRHPTRLRVGDPLDFWRVEALQDQRLLRLRAEMRLPGCGWLQLRVRPLGAASELDLCAIFEPHGLAGWAYWYATKPLHRLVFPRLGASLVRAAEGRPGAGGGVPGSAPGERQRATGSGPA